MEMLLVGVLVGLLVTALVGLSAAVFEAEVEVVKVADIVAVGLFVVDTDAVRLGVGVLLAQGKQVEFPY